MESAVINYVLQRLEEQYGGFAPLNTTRGGIIDSLGVILDFSNKVKVRLTIKKNIQSILDTSPTEMYGLSETPAAKNVFHVQEDDRDISAQK